MHERTSAFRSSTHLASVRVVAGILSLHVAGCAAVFKDTRDSVVITTDPAGANVRAGGRDLGAAPVTADFTRDRTHVLTVSAPGYTEQQVPIRRKPDTGWFVWDIATCVIPITMCIPVVVDAISGAWFNLESHTTVRLEPQGGASSVPTPPGATGTPGAPAPSGAPPANSAPATQDRPAPSEAGSDIQL